MGGFATALLLLAATLSRAERIARFKAPVLTHSDGLVKVYAACAEDVRREYQAPVARFAGETFAALARAEGRPPARAASPALVIHLGDVRTNRTDVIVRVATNGASVVTRLFLPNPAAADLDALRTEVARAYFRGVCGRELAAADAQESWRRTDPDYLLFCERRSLSDWLDRAAGDDADGFRLLYRVFRPGRLSRVEARIFASRLRLYPRTFARPFCGRFASLTFREAIAAAKGDPFVRLAAFDKANEMPVFGGGRGEGLQSAAAAYRAFLLELARGEKTDDEMKDLLEAAGTKLNIVYEGTSPDVKATAAGLSVPVANEVGTIP